MSAKPLPKNKPLDMREADFKRLVNNYTKYHIDLREDFISYWCEQNKSGTKMRFELEKTWDTGRRLGTWDRNNFGNKSQGKPNSAIIHVMHPKREHVLVEMTDIDRLDALLAKYSAQPTAYTIDRLSKDWPVEALKNCYNAIRENRLWDPTITKQDLENITDERRLKATVIVRTLDFYGCKGWTFIDTINTRNKLP